MSRQGEKEVTEWVTWYNEHMAYMNKNSADPFKVMEFSLKMIQGLLTICVQQQRDIIELEHGKEEGPKIHLPKGLVLRD